MQNLYTKDNTPINLLQDKDVDGKQGYCYLPDGTLINYGTYQVYNGNSATITFAAEFKDTEYSITIIQRWHTISQTYVMNEEKPKTCKIVFFNNDLQSNNGDYVGRYIAIGRWK